MRRVLCWLGKHRMVWDWRLNPDTGKWRVVLGCFRCGKEAETGKWVPWSPTWTGLNRDKEG